MTTLRWAILGTGQIANSFAKTFASDQATLYAVASRSDGKAHAFAEKYAIPHRYGSYEDLLDDELVDVVYIATPHSHHYQWIKASLMAGKHVLCEKVITLNKRQLDEVTALAEEKGLYLAEAMTIFHMPLYQELKRWAATHDVGPLKMVQVNFGSKKDTESDLYYFKKSLAGGALFDIGTYALSFARAFLTSKPTEIRTLGNLHQAGVDETSSIILRNAQGEMASVNLTFRAKMPKMGIVAYEHGYFTVMDYPRAATATFTDSEGRQQTIAAGDSAQALNYEVADFTRMVLEQGENETLAYTQDVLEIMDAARKEWGLEYQMLE